MRRKLFTLAAGTSAVLCIALCVLWVRSRRPSGDRFSLMRGDDRYTLVSARGRMTLFGPPPPATDPMVRRAAEEIVAELRNEQIEWEGYPGPPGAPRETWWFYWPVPAFDSPAERLYYNKRFHRGRKLPTDSTRPLLAALEDPARFAIAHVLLEAQFSDPRPPVQSSDDPRNLEVRFDRRDDGGAVSTGVLYDGLRVPLTMGPEARRRLDVDGTCAFEGHYDVAQLPAIRDQWHRRLDVPIRSVPYWTVVALTVVGPLLWAGGRVRRWRIRHHRARRGLCRACGYDLRHSPGKCPECGTPVARSRPRRAIVGPPPHCVGS